MTVRDPACGTRPLGFTPNGAIQTPRPKVTTMGGSTPTPMGPLLRLDTLRTTNRGFSWTTGTVFVQQIADYGGDWFSVMGSDVRTILGRGNLSLVAGGLTKRGTSLPDKPLRADPDRLAEHELQRAAARVREVVVLGGRVVDRVATAARRAALRRPCDRK